MKKALAIAALFVVSSVCYAKHNYTMTLTVTAEKNVENKNMSFSVGEVFKGLHGGFRHEVVKYIEAVGSDGNNYELVPVHENDVVLPGQYSARFDGKRIVILRGKKEVKLNVVDVEPANH